MSAPKGPPGVSHVLTQYDNEKMTHSQITSRLGRVVTFHVKRQDDPENTA